MKNIVIAGYVRSPFHFANKGALTKVRPDELAAQVVKGLVQKTGVQTNDIEDLILGCAFPEAEQGINVARIVAFLANLPITVAGTTVNRFCGSSMQAIHMATGAIQMNAGEVFIAAGVESMTRIPMGGFNFMPNPDLYKRYPQAYVSMGETAENLAEKYDISRQEQEEFTVLSHEKAVTAWDSGNMDDEIITIESRGESIDKDGCIRAGTTVEGLSGLKLAFSSNGTVTAGTSSPLTDGASATLICTEEYALKNNLTPLARIKSIAVSGCAPELMGYGPVEASKKALQRAGLGINDIDIFELNEAFAAQGLACIKGLNIDVDKINLDGGALALGHPLGGTGARITGKVASLLKREGKQYGLATQCIGGGQGIATIVEAI